MTSCCIPQPSFFFYRHQPIRTDISLGQISSDAGSLRCDFDQRYGVNASSAACAGVQEGRSRPRSTLAENTA
jgi:hypothetical protein